MTPAERRLISQLAAPPAQLDLPPLQSSDAVACDPLDDRQALGADCEYGHSKRLSPKAVDDYERLISAWLEEAKPGAFFSRDGGDIYKKPHLLFTAHMAGRIYQGNDLDFFETALSRQGHRAGVFVYRFAEMWILLLPCSSRSGRSSPAKRTAQPVTAAKTKPLDESFKDLIGEGSLSAEEMDSLLEVLASHEATPAV